jgi:hypothetical protein
VSTDTVTVAGVVALPEGTCSQLPVLVAEAEKVIPEGLELTLSCCALGDDPPGWPVNESNVWSTENGPDAGVPTVSVTGMDRGLFPAPLAVIAMLPL